MRPGPRHGGGVELATYHRAKGLEWDAVFLPMLEDGSLPIRQAFDDEEALEEERRLLYVGITRARVHLALSWAERRGGARRPSRFIAGLGDRSGSAVSRAARGARSASDGATQRGRAPDTPEIAALRAPGGPRGRRRTRCRPTSSPTMRRSSAIAEARPTTLGGARSGEGHGPDEARPLRDRDPRRALEALTADD